jgi:hypothetical protein
MTTKLIPLDHTEAAISRVQGWAALWLRSADICKEAGHLLRRHLLIEAVRLREKKGDAEERDADEEGNIPIDWATLPMFGSPENRDEEPGPYSDDLGNELVEQATLGDPDADGALCGIAIKFICEQRPLPLHLGTYINAILMHRLAAQPKRRRGGSRYANERRNVSIVGAVYRLQLLGFRPTRNRATRDKEAGESGCSIIAQALERMGFTMDESAVEKVWEQRSRYGVRE